MKMTTDQIIALFNSTDYLVREMITAFVNQDEIENKNYKVQFYIKPQGQGFIIDNISMKLKP